MSLFYGSLSQQNGKVRPFLSLLIKGLHIYSRKDEEEDAGFRLRSWEIFSEQTALQTTLLNGYLAMLFFSLSKHCKPDPGNPGACAQSQGNEAIADTAQSLPDISFRLSMHGLNDSAVAVGGSNGFIFSHRYFYQNKLHSFILLPSQ